MENNYDPDECCLVCGEMHDQSCAYPDDDYNDEMDGDAQSALASAGMGTDEDYGSFGYGEDEMYGNDGFGNYSEE